MSPAPAPYGWPGSAWPAPSSSSTSSRPSPWPRRSRCPSSRGVAGAGGSSPPWPPTGRRGARSTETAELFGLGDKLGQPARTLPQGDKKLLDVASAFALRPEVILMDEPTSGVSTADKHVIMDTLVQAAARMGVQAIIQVEHDMDIVFGYSDRIVALHEGRVLADATPAVVRADERLIDTVVGRSYLAPRTPRP